MLLSERLELLERRSVDKRMERTAQLFNAAESSDGFEAAIRATAERIKHASGDKLEGIIAFLKVSKRRASGDKAKAFQRLLRAAEGRASK